MNNLNDSVIIWDVLPKSLENRNVVSTTELSNDPVTRRTFYESPLKHIQSSTQRWMNKNTKQESNFTADDVKKTDNADSTSKSSNLLQESIIILSDNECEDDNNVEKEIVKESLEKPEEEQNSLKRKKCSIDTKSKRRKLNSGILSDNNSSCLLISDTEDSDSSTVLIDDENIAPLDSLSQGSDDIVVVWSSTNKDDAKEDEGTNKNSDKESKEEAKSKEGSKEEQKICKTYNKEIKNWEKDVENFLNKVNEDNTKDWETRVQEILLRKLERGEIGKRPNNSTETDRSRRAERRAKKREERVIAMEARRKEKEQERRGAIEARRREKKEEKRRAELEAGREQRRLARDENQKKDKADSSRETQDKLFMIDRNPDDENLQCLRKKDVESTKDVVESMKENDQGLLFNREMLSLPIAENISNTIVMEKPKSRFSMLSNMEYKPPPKRTFFPPIPPRENNNRPPVQSAATLGSQINLSAQLREIVVDGNNVALSHKIGKGFSEDGIFIVMDYFRQRGHTVKVFVPQYRRSLNCPKLEKWYEEGTVIFTPSRYIAGKWITPYDDRYILQYATMCKGIVISSDQFRDLYREKEEWRDTIVNRLLAPTFVGDIVMFPEDPLGRGGPTLDQFLRFPS